jgi:SAM-dependent methyltransferase
MGESAGALQRQLVALLAEMGPENIWRDVLGRDGEILARGHEDPRLTSPRDLAGVDFGNKSVLDLGCNLGSYCFLAARRGAARVTGMDSDPRAIRGCELLSRLYGLDNTRFRCADFIKEPPRQPHDIILLINFIGRRSLVKGILPVLDICRNAAREHIVVSVRLRYHIRRGLGVEPARMAELYGSRYVDGEFFNAAALVHDHLAMPHSRLSPDYDDKTIKRTFLYRVP